MGKKNSREAKRKRREEKALKKWAQERPDGEPFGFIAGDGSIHLYPGIDGSESPKARALLARLEAKREQMEQGVDIFQGASLVVESSPDGSE